MSFSEPRLSIIILLISLGRVWSRNLLADPAMNQQLEKFAGGGNAGKHLVELSRLIHESSAVKNQNVWKVAKMSLHNAERDIHRLVRKACPMCRMATVRTCSFVDAVRSSGPVRFASPVQFARFAGSRGSPVRTVRPKSEIVMKMVAVRAVEKPSSAFCTEFRCESFRDDVVFQFFPQQCLHLRGSYLLCKEVHLS